MRYVAVGDSFSEGIGDELPDGTLRGWTDLVAVGLAGAMGVDVGYANLAVRGKLLESVVTDQLEAALALSPPPTLLTLNGGGNDLLRPGGSIDRLVALTERAMLRCAEVGVRMVLVSGADPSARLPFGRRVRRIAVELSAAVGSVAARHEVTFVDVFADEELRRSCYWSADRLHLGPAGHRRVAGLVLAALGLPVAAHAVDPVDDPPRRVLDEARYYRDHVVPWVHRRVRGRSSGDGRSGKIVTWTPVSAEP